VDRQQIGTSFVGTHITRSRTDVHRSPGRISEAVKRTMDVVLSGMALVLLAPVIAVAALAIRLSGPGPVLFRQNRVGYLESPFVMFKFRTMRIDNDDSEHRAYVASLLAGERRDGGEAGLFKLTNDPRVTRIGAVLRKTSLDELPQLFNVLRGDMSLVGPRPALPWEAELFKQEHRARFTVKPGISGLWQVRGRNRLTMLEGLELDLEYVRRRGLLLDLGLILLTVPVTILGRGAR